MSALLRGLYRLPLADTWYWGMGIFVCFFVPGSLVLGWCGNNGKDRVMHAVHATALGIALTPFPYALFRKIEAPSLILFFFLGTFLLWLLPRVFAIRRKKDIGIRAEAGERSRGSIAYLAVLLTVVIVLLHFSQFTDVRLLADGFRMRTTEAMETDFHLGIINALRDSFPPVFPYASGTQFGHYHVAMHLQIEMFHRLLGTDTLKLSFFYFPFLYFFLLVAVPFFFVRTFLKSDGLAFLTAILMFGTDFSFIPGMLGAFAGKPWTVIFQTTIWSLFTLNGQLPASVVLFLAIFHLKRYCDNGPLRDLALFAVLGYAALGFKSSVGIHIAAASFLTGIVLLGGADTRGKGMKIAVISALLLAAIAADVYSFRGGVSNVIMTFAPFNIYTLSLKKLGIAPKEWYSHIYLFAAYLVGAFGVRIAGFWQMRNIFSSKPDPVVLFLVIFVLIGFALSEMVRISIFTGSMNNAVWFAVTSLMAAWLLLSYTLSEVRDRKVLFPFFIILILALSFPSTVQFLTKRFDRNYLEMTKESMEVIRLLDQAPAGSVVLHPLNQFEPSLAANFTGHQVVLSFYRSLGMMPLKEEDFLKRVRDVVLFFDPNSTIDREAVLKRYGVNLLYAPLPFAAFLDKEPMLSPVLKNRLYVLYRVKNGE
jgi:hypothetical protein